MPSVGGAANLKRWGKGQSGNPKGRPKALLTQAIRKAITEDDLDAIARSLISFAKAGKLEAVQLIWDRLEGKAVARNESGDPGDFDADLSDVDTKSLKAALKRVK